MHWSGRHRSGGPLAAAVVALAALLVVLTPATGPALATACLAYLVLRRRRC